MPDASPAMPDWPEDRQGIVVNLRLCGEKTRRLGLEWYLCEVQLMPAAIRAAVKDPLVHAHYTRFRDARGHAHSTLLRAALWWAGYRCGGDRRSKSVMKKKPEPDQAADTGRGHLAVEWGGVADASSALGAGPEAVGENAASISVSITIKGAMSPVPYFNSQEHMMWEAAITSDSSTSDLDNTKYTDFALNGCPQSQTSSPDRMVVENSEPADWQRLDVSKYSGNERTKDAAAMLVDRSCEDEVDGLVSLPSWTSRQRSAAMVFNRASQHRGDLLDGKEFPDMLGHASSVWFTSDPVKVASTRPIFLLCAIAFFGIFCYRGISFSHILASNGLVQPAPLHYRFRVLALRDATIPTTECNSYIFGILRGGCDLRPLGNSTLGRALGNGSLPAMLSFPVPVAADGFFLEVISGQPQGDPARWVIEAAGENGSGVGGDDDWRVVSASHWTISGLITRFQPERPAKVPMQRGSRTVMDMRPPWAWGLVEMGSPLILSLLWVLIVVAGCCGQHNLAKVYFALIFGIGSLLSAIAGGSFFLQERWPEASTQIVISTADAVTCVTAVFAKNRLFYALGIYGTLVLGNLLVQSLALSDDRASLLPSIFVNGGFYGLIFVCVVAVLRRKALHGARHLVLDDQRIYDDLWVTLISNPFKRRDLENLCEQASQMQTRMKAESPPRQFNRRRLEPKETTFESKLNALMSGIPGTLDLDRPVKSLDQLYIQATALHPILITKVQRWAAECKGFFAVKPTRSRTASSEQGWSRENSELWSHSTSAVCTQFVKWKGVESNETDPWQVKWSSLKSPYRAIEKATRSYCQDVSLLLDLCRQSIYFETVTSITRCLETLSRDPEVVLTRVKNRLDPAHNSSATAGFRNVSVNLRVVSEETTLLGVETHVCEVQLLLISFANIKKEEGHKKYIAFRNLRGE